METIDKVIFGDGQFFGINNMSEEKALQQAEKFHDFNNIVEIYDYAFNNGIRAFMLNTTERAKEICRYFREHSNKYSDVNFYPSLPYVHKYSCLVAEKGILPALNEIIFTDNSAMGLFGLFAKGGSALLAQDAVKIMQLLIDIEMKTFHDLNVKTIFLENTTTDLLLGLKSKVFFTEFSDYIKKKYKVLPGFLTMNLPVLLNSLEEWGIKEAVICTSINKLGFLMSPDMKSYEDVLKSIDKNKYLVMAMSVFASGAIKPEEAIAYISSQRVDSVVFGASSCKNIKETKELLDKYIVLQEPVV